MRCSKSKLFKLSIYLPQFPCMPSLYHTCYTHQHRSLRFEILCPQRTSSYGSQVEGRNTLKWKPQESSNNDYFSVCVKFVNCKGSSLTSPFISRAINFISDWTPVCSVAHKGRTERYILKSHLTYDSKCDEKTWLLFKPCFYWNNKKLLNSASSQGQSNQIDQGKNVLKYELFWTQGVH